MLAVENYNVAYGQSEVIHNLNFDVKENEIVAVMGRNGMGKTTTINSIMGIVPPRGGSIQFEGEEIAGARAFKIAQMGLGLVPEGRQIFPNLSLTENLIATAANRHRIAQPWTMQRIYDIFPLLAERHSSMGHLLSGGEQQMLAIGRALMTNPKLLILDEATEGLAPLIRREIWACLERLKQEGQSILVIDKNVDDLVRIAHRHYMIEKGRVVWSGDSAELRAADAVRQRYLGV